MRFRARDGRQCSDTVASLPASPLDLPPAPASPLLATSRSPRHPSDRRAARHLLRLPPPRSRPPRPCTRTVTSSSSHTPRQPARHECDHDDEQTSIKLTEEDTISNRCRGASDPAAALRPEGASPRPRRRGRDVPPQRRLLAHRNRRALTARGVGACCLAARGEATPTAAWRYAVGHDARTTDRHALPRATVPRGERRHAARPPPAHRLPRRHRAETPRSHRRRRRNRPVARALRWTPAHHGRPHRWHRRSSGPATHTTPCGGPPRGASGTRRSAAAPSRTAGSGGWGSAPGAETGGSVNA